MELFASSQDSKSSRDTRGYGTYGPKYLAEAAQALEAWIGQVLKAAHTNSHGISTPRKPRGRKTTNSLI
jgi:hypothetical protein